MAFRVSSQHVWLKPFNISKHQAFPSGFGLELREIPFWGNLRTASFGFSLKPYQNPVSVNLTKFALENRNGAKPRNLSYGFCPKFVCLSKCRRFSSSSFMQVDRNTNVVVKNRKSLPWRAKSLKANGVGKLNKVGIAEASVSSWEESARIFFNESEVTMSKADSEGNRNKMVCMVQSGKNSYRERKEEVGEEEDGSTDTLVGAESSGVANVEKTLSWLKASHKPVEGRKSENLGVSKSSGSSWEESARKYSESGVTTYNSKGGKWKVIGSEKSWQNDYMRGDQKVEEDRNDKEEDDDDEVIDDPRWDKIKSRFTGMPDTEANSRKPESRRWSKQENWGRKTWKEATESTIPKMVGEGIYGVGPVLAALSAARREFYALYVQEGLDLSGSNRKKKDKKRIEKVLMMAEKLGLRRREASKHDLNMVADNRPHQGLVLDASPLEMVRIKELDPVTVEGEKSPMWLALDEVMDPQNLGAIIRSAYFFGASGVVLCAKNSAPLSGVVSKASAGSLELMELRSCKNMMQFLASSANNGWRVLGGSVSSKAVPVNKVLPGVPTILVLGSEGTGLRPLVERSCTELIRIPGNIPVDPTAGRVERGQSADIDHGCSEAEFHPFLAVESLNVSVAAGVLLYHLIGSHCSNISSSSSQQISAPE